MILTQATSDFQHFLSLWQGSVMKSRNRPCQEPKVISPGVAIKRSNAGASSNSPSHPSGAISPFAILPSAGPRTKAFCPTHGGVWVVDREPRAFKTACLQTLFSVEVTTRSTFCCRTVPRKSTAWGEAVAEKDIVNDLRICLLRTSYVGHACMELRDSVGLRISGHLFLQ